MTSDVWLYNPARMPRDELFETMVGRDVFLEELTFHIRAQRSVAPPHHLTLIGPRGIGKTTILVALDYIIKEAPDLFASFIPVLFCEEEDPVDSLYSFLDRTLKIYLKTDPSAETEYKEAKEAQVPAKDLYGLLNSISDRRGKQLVLLMDNLDRIVRSICEGKGREKDIPLFLEFLKKGRFIVIGSAIRMQRPGKRTEAIWETIEQRRIPSLEKETEEIIRKRALKDGELDLLKGLPDFKGRMTAISRLSGGNPRYAVLLYRCMKNESLLDIEEAFQKIIDELTPLYQGLLEILSPGDRKILNALARRGGRAARRELADEVAEPGQTRQSLLNTIGTNIESLIESGLVVEAGESGRGKTGYYETAPPLFQIWYEMRYFAKEHTRTYLVRFYEYLYPDPEKLRERRKDLMERFESELMSGREGIALRAFDASLLMGHAQGFTDEDWEDVEKLCASYPDGSKVQELLDRDFRRYHEENNQMKAAELLLCSARCYEKKGDLRNSKRSAARAVLYAKKSIPKGKEEFLQRAFLLLYGTFRRMGKAGAALRRLDCAKRYASAIEDRNERGRALGNVGIEYLKNRIFEKALPILSEALEVFTGLQDKANIATTLYSLGNCLRDMGRSEDALSNYTRALSMREARLKKDEENTVYQGEVATTLNSLGNCHSRMGRLEEALADYRRALEIYEALLKKYQENTVYQSRVAATLNNLGNCLSDMGRFEDALSNYTRALSMQEALLKKDEENTVYRGDVATTLNNLGNCHCRMGRFEDALSSYARALSMREVLLKKDEENTVYQSWVAATLNNLGNCLSDLGRFEDALSNYTRALSMREVLLKKDEENTVYHGDMATTLNNLGTCLSDIGRIEEALANCRRALKHYEALLKKDEENTVYQSWVAATLNNLGNCLYDTSRLEEALTNYRQALSMREALLKKDEKNTNYQGDMAMALDNLGNCLSGMGRLEEALPNYTRALSMREALLKKDEENTVYQGWIAAALNNLGNCLFMTGSLDEAILDLRRASVLWLKSRAPEKARRAKAGIVSILLEQGFFVYQRDGASAILGIWKEIEDHLAGLDNSSILKIIVQKLLSLLKEHGKEGASFSLALLERLASLGREDLTKMLAPMRAAAAYLVEPDEKLLDSLNPPDRIVTQDILKVLQERPPLGRAVSIVKEGRYEKGAGMLKEILTHEPCSEEALELLLECLKNTGKLPEMLRYIEAALSERPRSAELLSLAGKTHFSLKNHGEAEAYFLKALQSGTRSPDIHIFLSEIYSKREDFAGSLQEIGLALENDLHGEARLNLEIKSLFLSLLTLLLKEDRKKIDEILISFIALVQKLPAGFSFKGGLPELSDRVVGGLKSQDAELLRSFASVMEGRMSIQTFVLKFIPRADVKEILRTFEHEKGITLGRFRKALAESIAGVKELSTLKIGAEAFFDVLRESYGRLPESEKEIVDKLMLEGISDNEDVTRRTALRALGAHYFKLGKEVRRRALSRMIKMVADESEDVDLRRLVLDVLSILAVKCSEEERKMLRKLAGASRLQFTHEQRRFLESLVNDNFSEVRR